MTPALMKNDIIGPQCTNSRTLDNDVILNQVMSHQYSMNLSVICSRGRRLGWTAEQKGSIVG